MCAKAFAKSLCLRVQDGCAGFMHPECAVEFCEEAGLKLLPPVSSPAISPACQLSAGYHPVFLYIPCAKAAPCCPEIAVSANYWCCHCIQSLSQDCLQACKHFVRRGYCLFEADCFYRHPETDQIARPVKYGPTSANQQPCTGRLRREQRSAQHNEHVRHSYGAGW